MFWCWRKNAPSAPLSHNVWGLGPGVAVAHRFSSWGAQGNGSRFPSYIWTQHARIMSSGTDSVLSWAHHSKPLAPFKYYITMVSNASSLAPKDTWRSQFILCDLHDDFTPKRENIMSLFTEEKQKQAPLSWIAEEKNIQKVPESEGLEQRGSLSLLCGSFKHTHTHLGRDEVLLGSKNSEARRTQRAFESGMKHVCSIYMMEFYVFM